MVKSACLALILALALAIAVSQVTLCKGKRADCARMMGSGQEKLLFVSVSCFITYAGGSCS